MKKVVVLINILILFIFSVAPNAICETTDVNIIYVGGSGNGNFSKIQSAIDDSEDGYTVFVFSGTYNENIVLDKSINLIGEDKENTIIDGGKTDNVIEINANSVTITGFTIKNSRDAFPNACINVSSNFNTITGNIIVDNYYGITLYHTSNNSILKNNITDNTHCGIYISGALNNIISGNTIKRHEYNGIGMYDHSNDNNINNNSISYNDYCGINIYVSSGNKITDNIISDNNIGIHLPYSRYVNHISNNVLSNNAKDFFKVAEISIYVVILAIASFLFTIALFILWREKRYNVVSASKDADFSIDARGKLCPVPLIMAKKKIAKMKKGEILEIITTDFVVKENITRFGLEHYTLVRVDEKGEIIRLIIKK